MLSILVSVDDIDQGYSSNFVSNIQVLSKIKTGWYLDKMQSQNNASPLHPWRWHTSLLEMDSLKVLLFQPTSNACKTSWAPGIVGYKNIPLIWIPNVIFLYKLYYYLLEKRHSHGKQAENEKYEYQMMFMVF